MPVWRKRRDTEEDVEPGFVKVRFHLEQNEDGYPPQTSELVWGERDGDRLRVANIPWFVTDLAIDDVIEAHDVDGMLEFDRVVERSGHSTLRVVLFDESETQALRDRLRELGCDSELSHLARFISVDVPPEVDMKPVLDVLVPGEEGQRWEFESGHVGDPHLSAFDARGFGGA